MKSYFVRILPIAFLATSVYAVIPKGAGQGSGIGSGQGTAQLQGTQSQQAAEVHSLASAHSLGDSGITSKSFSNKLSNVVLQSDQSAYGASKFSKDGLKGGSGSAPGRNGLTPQNPAGGPAPGSAKPAPPLPPPYVQTWKLKGVVLGGLDKSAAVFDNGVIAPLIVHPGHAIDSHTTLVAVSQQAIIVKQNGHLLSLSPW